MRSSVNSARVGVWVPLLGLVLGAAACTFPSSTPRGAGGQGGASTSSSTSSHHHGSGGSATSSSTTSGRSSQGGNDAGADSASDAGSDASSVDAGPDASGMDAGPDAGQPDAAPPTDAGGSTDASADASTGDAGGNVADAGTDSGAPASTSELVVIDMSLSQFWVVNGITGVAKAKFSIPDGNVWCSYAQLPDYSAAYFSGCQTRALYYVVNDTVTQKFDLSTATTTLGGVAVNPTGSYMYLSGTPNMVVNTTRGASFNTITNLTSTITEVGGVFTPDGSRSYILIDGSYGSVSLLHVIDGNSHTQLTSIQLPKGYGWGNATMNPSGTLLYMAQWGASQVQVLDVSPSSAAYHQIVAIIGVGGEPRSIAFRPAGDYAYVALDTGGVAVLSTARGASTYNTKVATISNAGSYNDSHTVQVALDGRFAYVASGSVDPGKLFVIDSLPTSATFNTVVKTFTVGQQSYVIAVRPGQ